MGREPEEALTKKWDDGHSWAYGWSRVWSQETMGSGLHFQVGFAGTREEDGSKDAAISSEMLLAWTRSPATEVGPRVRWWRWIGCGVKGSPQVAEPLGE